jgi:hypothetical protein
MANEEALRRGVRALAGVIRNRGVAEIRRADRVHI